MFKIEEVDTQHFQKQTRKSTMIIMAIFIVIGFITARLSLILFGEQYNNHIVLNLAGAFVGLLITFAIVNSFFKKADWMKEAMYAWHLKRHVMSIYNVLSKVQEAADQRDEKAIKILRFYQLATEQMYQLDGNDHGLIELRTQMQQLEFKMKEMRLEPNQTEFDMDSIKEYRNNKS